jgi:hypothetical protein
VLKKQIVVLCSLFLMISCRFAAAQVSPDILFPGTTQGYFSVTSIDAFKQQWQKTRLGELLKYPLMKPAGEELQKQIETNWIKRVGLSIDDLKSLPTGSVSGGLIAAPGKTPGFVLVVGVNGRNTETLDFLQQIGQKLTEQNVAKATSPVDGASKVIKTYFTFPVTEKNPKGGIAIYLVTQDMLVITDQHHLADLFVARLNGDHSSPLKEKPAYQAIMARVTQKSKFHAETPLFHWYIEPLEFAAAIRTLTEEEKTSVKKAPGQIDAYELLAAHGFKEIQGAGGILDLATENGQLAFRTMVYAPKPHVGAAIKMLSFQNNDNFALPEWLPNDAARFTILHIDPQAIFENIGPIFDNVVDEPGVWEQVLQAFKEDKYRQQIDIQKELISLLGSRLILTSHFQKPISTDSSRFIAALELKPEKEAEVKAALDKLLSSEQDAKKIEKNGLIFWQSKPEDKTSSASSSSSARRRNSIVPGGARSTGTNIQRNKTTTTGKDSESKESGKIARELFFDKGALTVAQGCIFISNNMDDLALALDPSHKETSVGKSEDYAAHIQLLEKLDAGKGDHFMQIFAHSGDLIEPTYELIRQGKMSESQTILGVVIREAIASPENKATQKNIFNGALLPEFEKIRQYFGTAGVVGTVEDGGWLIEGVQIP